MSWRSKLLIQRTPGGRVRTWQIFVVGDHYYTETGDYGSVEPRISANTICHKKNVGMSSERSAETVALDTAKSMVKVKLDGGYVLSLEELEEQDKIPRAMLAKAKLEKERRHIDVALDKGACFVQPKLDGYRCLASKTGLWTRELRRINTCKHIEAALKPVFEKHPDLVIDGELYNHDYRDDFGKIQSLLTKENTGLFDSLETEQTIQYHVYDFVSNLKFRDRLLDGRRLIEGTKFLVNVRTTRVRSIDYIYEKHKDFVLQGYEGTMVRISGKPYEQNKRASQLIKLKDFQDEEFTILDINEGKGAWAGLAKSITCQLGDDTFNAGCSGSMGQLKSLLNMAEQYIGGKATVQYPSKFPSGKPRFPIATKYFTR